MSTKPHLKNPLFNLVKYDLIYIYKQLIVFYGIILFFAIISCLTVGITNNFLIIFIHDFAQGATLGFSLGAVINASMRTWARFRNTIYGDESYLTHTLPISKSVIWGSKFLTSLIIVLTSAVVIGIAYFIIFVSNGFTSFWSFNSEDMLQFYLMLIFIILGQILYIIQCGYLGFILGHRHYNNRMAFSVIYGLGIYLLGGIIIISCTMLWSCFNESIHQALFQGIIDNKHAALLLLGSIGLEYLVLIIASYFIGNRLLQKGINVE